MRPTSFFKPLLLSALLLTTPFASNATDNTNGASTAGSEAVSLGAGLVVVGTISVVQGSAIVKVEEVEMAGDLVNLVVKGVGNTISATIQLSGKAAHELPLASGTLIEITATSAGYLLTTSGKALAFVPNEIGKGLLHHSKS